MRLTSTAETSAQAASASGAPLLARAQRHVDGPLLAETRSRQPRQQRQTQVVKSAFPDQVLLPKESIGLPAEAGIHPILLKWGEVPHAQLNFFIQAAPDRQNLVGPVRLEPGIGLFQAQKNEILAGRGRQLEPAFAMTVAKPVAQLAAGIQNTAVAYLIRGPGIRIETQGHRYTRQEPAGSRTGHQAADPRHILEDKMNPVAHGHRHPKLSMHRDGAPKLPSNMEWRG